MYVQLAMVYGLLVTDLLVEIRANLVCQPVIDTVSRSVLYFSIIHRRRFMKER